MFLATLYLLHEAVLPETQELLDQVLGEQLALGEKKKKEGTPKVQQPFLTSLTALMMIKSLCSFGPLLESLSQHRPLYAKYESTSFSCSYSVSTSGVRNRSHSSFIPRHSINGSQQALNKW